MSEGDAEPGKQCLKLARDRSTAGRCSASANSITFSVPARQSACLFVTQCRPRPCQSWATGAQVEEQRYPLPAATAVRLDHAIRNPRFPQGLDEQTGFLERQKIAF